MKESKNFPLQKKFNVFLIGDSCTDRYIYGSCDRLNPEAPVPILKQSKDIKVNRGMVYNVKDNLKNLGVNVSIRAGGKPCIKTRYIDTRSGQQVLRVDEDFISPKFNTNKLELKQYDAIVISDYSKGFINDKVILDIIKAFKDKPIFIDTKIKDLSFIDSPNVFVKINEHEFHQLRNYNCNLVVTLGSKGAMYNAEVFELFSLAKSIDVVDVCGAGDTFLASLTYKFLQTRNIKKSIRFANVAASITVQHEGNYAPSLQEVEHNYEKYYNKD